MILFGRAVCGTLGGGFLEKPLPFNCFCEMGFPLQTWLVFQTASLELGIEPFWMFVAHSLTPLNCCWLHHWPFPI